MVHESFLRVFSQSVFNIVHTALNKNDHFWSKCRPTTDTNRLLPELYLRLFPNVFNSNMTVQILIKGPYIFLENQRLIIFTNELKTLLFKKRKAIKTDNFRLRIDIPL